MAIYKCKDCSHEEDYKSKPVECFVCGGSRFDLCSPPRSFMNEKLIVPNKPDLITPENLSKKLLYEILQAAFMDVSYDKDGDILVQEDVRCFVMPNEDIKDRIRLLTIFGFEPSSSEIDRLRCVNVINEKYLIVRAYSTQNDTLSFDYEILIKGGITKKNLVLAVKRFCSIPRLAVREFGEGLAK